MSKMSGRRKRLASLTFKVEVHPGTNL